MRTRRLRRNAMGTRLRELREEQARTLSELATAAGISPGHLSRVERGLTATSFTTATRLADLLGVSPSALAEIDREYGEVNDRLVAALVRQGVDPELAHEIQGNISTAARLALLAGLDHQTDVAAG